VIVSRFLLLKKKKRKKSENKHSAPAVKCGAESRDGDAFIVVTAGYRPHDVRRDN
jgi:hypothetical protein